MPKKNPYSIEFKLSIIDKIKKGTTKAAISRDHNIPESTLRGWMKQEDGLQSFLQDVDTEEGMKRKKRRLADNGNLDKALFSFFVQKRNDGIPITGPLLQTQADILHEKLNPAATDPGEGTSVDFQCTKGWLHRWKKRHGVRHVRTAGEVMSADLDGATEFLPKIAEMVQEGGYGPEQIYNADETALYWRIMPDSILVESVAASQVNQ